MRGPESISNAFEAFGKAFRHKRRVTYAPYGADDAPPETPIEDLRIFLSLLSREELERWLSKANAETHGRYILGQIFPPSINPTTFGSRDGSIVLGDRPVQALGWEDVERLVAMGVAEGLDETEIRCGIWREAERRGVDLEWHFWEIPPGESESSVLQYPLEISS